MNSKQPKVHMINGLESIPDITLILGTDAAGKDHVANILTRMIEEKGGVVEKRQRFLSGKQTTASSSVGKSQLELLFELVFLGLYPCLGHILPKLLTHILQRDLLQFVQPKAKLVVVGHNCLRGLAFHWGRKCQMNEPIQLSVELCSVLADMCNLNKFHTVVLDVDDEIRKQRIQKRVECGEADNFDRYMARDSQRSEGIENTLVWLARTYLNGQLIENNDLAEQEICSLLSEEFTKRLSENVIPMSRTSHIGSFAICSKPRDL